MKRTTHLYETLEYANLFFWADSIAQLMKSLKKKKESVQDHKFTFYEMNTRFLYCTVVTLSRPPK